LKPTAQNSLMSICVDGRDDNVSILDLLRINIDDGDTLLPRVPLLVGNSDFVVDECELISD